LERLGAGNRLPSREIGDKDEMKELRTFINMPARTVGQ